jgi:hypothetical protein
MDLTIFMGSTRNALTRFSSEYIYMLIDMRYAVSSRTSSYKLEMPGLRKRLCLSEKFNQTIMVMITEKKIMFTCN